MRFKDQLHREIELPYSPKRIVSLVPSQTELLVDLGLSDRLVGVTKFCVHPEGLKTQKSIVGGTKTVHFEKIKALAPDFILCNKEENTQEMVVALEKIAPVWVSDVYSIEDNVRMIYDLGAIFSVQEKARNLTEKILAAVSDFKNFMLSKPSKKVAYVIWKNPYMVAGTPTYIDYLLQLNKFDNIFSSYGARYPEVSESALKGAAMVFLSTEPFPFNERDVIQLKTALQTEVRLVDGEYFSWYGSRILKGLSYFKTLH